MRALIVKTSALGDVVQTFPVVEYLRTRQSVERIGWVVEHRAASLVRAHPLVDTVVEIDSARFRSHMPSLRAIRELRDQKRAIQDEPWDVVFDLQANCKSAVATLCAQAPTKVGYGRCSAAESPNILATTVRFDPPQGLPIRDEYLWIVKQFFRDGGDFDPQPIDLSLSALQDDMLAAERKRWPSSDPVWFIAVGSKWPNKMCQVSSLIDLLVQVKRQYAPYFVFVAGSPDELRAVAVLAHEFSSSSHVLFRPELPLLQRLMGSSQAVVAVDSLLLHLAATTAVPTFGLFGPSMAHIYAPKGQRHGSFQGVCPLHICAHKRCARLRTCEQGFCLKSAEVSDIFSALQAWQAALPAPYNGLRTS